MISQAAVWNCTDDFIKCYNEKSVCIIIVEGEKRIDTYL